MTLVFGIVAFVAGLLAPSSFKEGVTKIAQQISAKIPGRAAPGTAAASTPTATSGNTPVTTAASTAAAAPASAPAAAASSPLPAASLILPTVAIASPSFALQAAQFSTAQPASQLASSIQAQGVTSTVVLMGEPAGNSWSVVTVGRFGSADEALSQRHYLSLKLGLPPNMGTISLPPPPK
ncbi:SPOR domain-containing protein [Polaromonas aquatica]|uniref:SPOR domain-containing protein n=1 Tax=Polaromonas aquatica TaxID=332657 RepID=UPI003D65295A